MDACNCDQALALTNALRRLLAANEDAPLAEYLGTRADAEALLEAFAPKTVRANALPPGDLFLLEPGAPVAWRVIGPSRLDEGELVIQCVDGALGLLGADDEVWSCPG